MKGLKKVALASAIAAVSAGAQAELKALDDAAMGELTGQAGLTIDIETSFTIGEFQYRDQAADADEGTATSGGSILIRGISQGGNNVDRNGDAVENLAGEQQSSLLDNIRLTLDVAGASSAENSTLNYGFSEIGRLTAFLGANGNTDPLLGQNALAAGAIAGGDLNARFQDFGVDGAATDPENVDFGVGQFLNPIFAAENGGASGSFAQAIDGAVDANGLFQPTVDPTRPGFDPNDPTTVFTSENGSDAAGIEDGDLVLHFGFTDAFQAAGGFDRVVAGEGEIDGTTGIGLANISWAQARDTATRAVDYNFSIDEIALAGSGYEVGSLDQDLGIDTGVSATTTTVLISGLDIRGFLGPRDIHIENDGNGFGADGSGIDFDNDGDTFNDNVGDADSKITISNYFRVTDLEVYIDIAGLSLEGVEIHNDRGDTTGLDGTSSFGFAHSRQTIFAVNDAVLDLNVGDATNPVVVAVDGIRSQYVDGLQLNTEFKGDIDIDAIRFGGIREGESIGQIFLTDIESVSNWTISAHD